MLGKAAVDYYTQLFTDEPISDLESILQHIPTLVSAADNEMLMRIPDMQEIKDDVWSSNLNSVTGPDGYNGYFSERVGIFLSKM